MGDTPYAFFLVRLKAGFKFFFDMNVITEIRLNTLDGTILLCVGGNEYVFEGVSSGLSLSNNLEVAGMLSRSCGAKFFVGYPGDWDLKNVG